MGRGKIRGSIVEDIAHFCRRRRARGFDGRRGVIAWLLVKLGYRVEIIGGVIDECLGLIEKHLDINIAGPEGGWGAGRGHCDRRRCGRI